MPAGCLASGRPGSLQGRPGRAVTTRRSRKDYQGLLLFVGLGEVRAFDPTVFSGRRLFLQVTLDGAVMEPRISLDSVPYAIRASGAENADAVGGIPAENLQQRVTGSCGTGNFINAVNPDGTVSCAPDLSGSGDIAAVNAGTGLEGGGPAGDLTLSLLTTCGPGELLTLSLLTTCGPGQLLKWNGSSWGCAADLDTDTNSGGDITSVTTAATSGLVGGTVAGDAALSLLTSCSPGQLLKWNGAAWGCAADLDTDTNSGGDITDVLAGAGLVGGGTAGAVTLDVVGTNGIAVAAVRELARDRDADPALLLAASRDPDLLVGVTAVEALGKLHAQGQVPVQELIARATDRRLDERVRVSALNGLGQVPSPEAARLLAELASRGDVGERRTAAILLAHQAPDVAVPALIGLLGDADEDVRSNALESLRARSRGRDFGTDAEAWRAWWGARSR